VRSACGVVEVFKYRTHLLLYANQVRKKNEKWKKKSEKEKKNEEKWERGRRRSAYQTSRSLGQLYADAGASA
jgi:hypothetical protein